MQRSTAAGGGLSCIAGRNLRALVVDDNSFLRYMVRQQLMTMGFSSIDQADSGDAALLLLHKKPDIIICDIAMAPLNGFEFLQRLREREDSLAQIPVLFLTGDGNARAVRRAIELHVAGYMLKPMRQDVLRYNIMRILKQGAG